MVLRKKFVKNLEEDAKLLSQSLDVDKRLFLADIWNSQVHNLMLRKQGIISKEDLRGVLRRLGDAQKKFEEGKFEFKDDLEDVHMNIEDFVTGNFKRGGVMHTARSRNDQTVTDTRMVCRGEINDVIEELISLKEVLLKLAEKHKGTLMPGYTHLRVAQPYLFGHWCLAYHDAFARDVERLEDAYGRVNLCPLGAGAFAGTSFPIDRKFTAELLGFDGLVENSLDAVASRDFAAEILADLAILASNLSRLCEELIIFGADGFGFIKMADEFATGSSIMPQKRNPDMAELIKGKTGRVYGNLINLLTTLKGITYSYNRDLQEDKTPLWDSFDTVKLNLKVMTGMLDSLEVDKERMGKTAEEDKSIFATDLANLLVRKGLAFRQAYDIISKLDFNALDFNDFNKKITKYDLRISRKEFTAITSSGISACFPSAMPWANCCAAASRSFHS